jgi:hypothetical protein
MRKTSIGGLFYTRTSEGEYVKSQILSPLITGGILVIQDLAFLHSILLALVLAAY